MQAFLAISKTHGLNAIGFSVAFSRRSAEKNTSWVRSSARAVVTDHAEHVAAHAGEVAPVELLEGRDRCPRRTAETSSRSEYECCWNGATRSATAMPTPA